jgi:hypothetical protein
MGFKKKFISELEYQLTLCLPESIKVRTAMALKVAFFRCARTLQGLHSIRLWTPTKTATSAVCGT